MIDLDDLDRLVSICEAIDTSVDQPTKQFAKLDPNRFKAFVKSPTDISEDTMRDIAAVIDGKLDISETPLKNNTNDGIVTPATPGTMDRLLNSTAIIYITDRDIPVAAANLIDPTVESYQGFIPLTEYSLDSGYNLDGRVQQEFFAVAEEYRDQGVGHELKAQISATGIPTFIIVDSDDKNSVKGVAANGYHLICEMDSPVCGEDKKVQLWIDHPEQDDPAVQPQQNEIV